MEARISVLGGDGIGPEVTLEAVKVLDSIAKRFGHDFTYVAGDVGGMAIDKTGTTYILATPKVYSVINIHVYIFIQRYSILYYLY